MPPLTDNPDIEASSWLQDSSIITKELVSISGAEVLLIR